MSHWIYKGKFCNSPTGSILIFLPFFSCPSLHGHKSGDEGGRINSIHSNLSSLPTHSSQGQSPTYCTELSGNNKKLPTKPKRTHVLDISQGLLVMAKLKCLVPTEKESLSCHRVPYKHNFLETELRWGLQGMEPTQHSGYTIFSVVNFCEINKPNFIREYSRMKFWIVCWLCRHMQNLTVFVQVCMEVSDECKTDTPIPWQSMKEGVAKNEAVTHKTSVFVGCCIGWKVRGQ